jgi:ribonuclease G
MHKEIIVNSSPNEVRVALLEDREVAEFSMERAESRRVVGNVYKGVVTAVRPGLQAAFVEIGMEKGGFLHVSDLVHDDPDDEDDGRGGRRRRRGRREGLRPIETMLKEGDELMVQVTKEIIGTKGPRLTADISLPGRFMVLMPKGDHVGVSRKIEDRKERHRLRDLLSGMKPDDEAGAFIIRTAAIGIEPRMLQRDMEYLRRLWKDIQAATHGNKAPAVVHQDVGMLVGMLRDIFKDDIDSLVVDSREEYNELVQYVRDFSPELRERIHFYEGDVPIFDKYGVEQELKKSLEKKVWMKRGGFLVIDEAEALVAIDVNTGRYTGRKNQAETIFKTNMLAAREIARQLRLRDVGGIIVCDFIDMDTEEDKRKVLNELRNHLKRDRARTKTFPVTDLGLVEMSRQRVQQSLKDRLSDDCPYCGGGGQVLSTDTLANKVERLLLKLAATGSEKAVQVRANPTLALILMTDRANGLQSIARSTGIRIDVVDDPRLHREQFQIISLHRRRDLVAEIEKSAGERREAGTQEPRAADSRRRPDRERPERGRPDRERPGRRRPDREEEPGDRERGSRRRRGRRDEADSPRSSDRSGERRAAAEGAESGTRERPVRRRRPRPNDAPPRERMAEPVKDPVAETSGPSTNADHPAAGEGDETRRRRRRRGRRGGRGRRRRGEGEGASEGAPTTGTPAVSESTETVRSEAVVEHAPGPDSRRDLALQPEDRQPEDRRPADRTSVDPGPQMNSGPAPTGAQLDEDASRTAEEGRPRRRRRRRGTRGSGSATSRPQPQSGDQAPGASVDPVATPDRTNPGSHTFSPSPRKSGW